MDAERTEEALYVCKSAYAAKLKGDISTWQECSEMIKKEFDTKYGPAWHCVVGSHFGSFVSHESRNIIYVFIGNMGVLLFKHG